MKTDLMSNEKYTYEGLSSKYAGFKVPTYQVKIDGKELFKAKDLHLKELTVELTCEHEAGGCTIEVMGAYQTGQRSFQGDFVKSFFQIGKKVEVSLGYIKILSVFTGYIASVRYHVSEEMPVVHLECVDVKGLMMHNQTTEQLVEEKYADVVSALFKKQPYQYFTEGIQVDAINTPKKKIEVAGESDYQFLVRLANRVGYEFFVSQGKLYFRKPCPFKTPMIELEWGKHIYELEHRAALEGQVLELEVRSSNALTAKAVTGKAKAGSLEWLTAAPKKALGKLKRVVVDTSVLTEQEAADRAQVLLNKLNERAVELRVETVGIPEIVPGRFISIKKLGEPIEGKYYLLRVRHTINESSFTTHMEGRGE